MTSNLLHFHPSTHPRNTYSHLFGAMGRELLVTCFPGALIYTHTSLVKRSGLSITSWVFTDNSNVPSPALGVLGAATVRWEEPRRGSEETWLEPQL